MSESLLRCFDFTDKTACVTGAASGIGRATATLLAYMGAVVHAVDRDQKGLDALVAENPKEIKPIAYDQSKRESVEHLVATDGPVDILANNAGVLHYELLLDLKWDDLEHVVSIAFVGAIGLTRLVGAAMVARRKGAIREGQHLTTREDRRARIGPSRHTGQLRRSRADADGDLSASAERSGELRRGDQAHSAWPLRPARGYRAHRVPGER